MADTILTLELDDDILFKWIESLKKVPNQHRINLETSYFLCGLDRAIKGGRLDRFREKRRELLEDRGIYWILPFHAPVGHHWALFTVYGRSITLYDSLFCPWKNYSEIDPEYRNAIDQITQLFQRDGPGGWDLHIPEIKPYQKDSWSCGFYMLAIMRFLWGHPFLEKPPPTLNVPRGAVTREIRLTFPNFGE